MATFFHTIIINKGGQVTKSIIVVTICYKLLCHSSRFLISNFLASTDIKVFGRTYLFAMLLLIGLALFLHPGCFCLVRITVETAFKILDPSLIGSGEAEAKIPATPPGECVSVCVCACVYVHACIRLCVRVTKLGLC